MRRAATSANALRLPPPSAPAVSLGIVRGRQQVIRAPGIFLTVHAGKRRTAYLQFDGEMVLADECKCWFDWQPDFLVKRLASCPIDQHRARALQEDAD